MMQRTISLALALGFATVCGCSSAPQASDLKQTKELPENYVTLSHSPHGEEVVHVSFFNFYEIDPKVTISIAEKGACSEAFEKFSQASNYSNITVECERSNKFLDAFPTTIEFQHFALIAE